MWRFIASHESAPTQHRASVRQLDPVFEFTSSRLAAFRMSRVRSESDLCGREPLLRGSAHSLNADPLGERDWVDPVH